MPLSDPFLRVRPVAHFALALAVLFAGGPSTAALGAPSAPDDPPTTATVRAELEAGRPQVALETARLALEYAPADPGLLAVAVEAAERAGERDEALAHVFDALALATLTADELSAFTAQLDRLDPKPGEAKAVLDVYAAELLELARGFERRKLYANAVDLLLRCADTASAAAASKLLDKIYANDKAVEALLASGVDVPIDPPKHKKSGDWIAREDKKRRQWSTAYEIKSPNYTIVTNMGYEMGHAMSTAMEQMGQFYREVFRYRERGGTMRRCVISVYAQRTEFDTHEPGISPSVGGFFAPLENRVATYDQRTVGRTLPDLWSTLFHEASHQFTSAVTKNLTPGWLNEGTASYFEGARLRSNGRVETNLVPESRLRALHAMMGHGRGTNARATVRLLDVVSYFQPGSYQGAYYPWGWGLVYFIHNFENERSERVYLQPYFDYWQAYAGGAKHDVVDRFAEYFVRRPKYPGVESIDAFEAEFSRWIGELYDLHFGGPEQADALVARGRKQAGNGKHAYAAESFKWALRKRPDHLEALFGLGAASQELGAADSAIYYLRRALEVARVRPSDDILAHFDGLTVAGLVEDGGTRLRKLDDAVTGNVAASTAAFEERVAALATAYAQDKFPRAALLALMRAERLSGPSAALRAKAASIHREQNVETRRWRRIPLGGAMGDWLEGGGGTWEPDGWVLRGEHEAGALATALAPLSLPNRWRFEGTFTLRPVGDEGAFVGLAFGAQADGSQKLVGFTPAGGVVFVEVTDGKPQLDPVGRFQPIEGHRYKVAVEARETEVEVFIDGTSIGSRPLESDDLVGRVGFFLQGARARFEDTRVLF